MAFAHLGRTGLSILIANFVLLWLIILWLYLPASPSLHPSLFDHSSWFTGTLLHDDYPYPFLPSTPPADLAVQRRAALQRLHAIPDLAIGIGEDHNKVQLEGIIKCLESAEDRGDGPCVQGMPKVIVTTYNYLHCAVGDCEISGETMWMRSVNDALVHHGFFLLTTYIEDLWRFHTLLGDIVTHYWLNDGHLVLCIDDAGCQQTPENPDGIPLWKMFTTTFWGSRPGDGYWRAPRESWSFNPLGNEWTLTPYRMPDDHYYLGYALPDCAAHPVIPHSERPNTLNILAKQIPYFYFGDSWDPSVYAVIKKKTGLELLSVARHEGNDSKEGLPEGLTSLGKLDKADYDAMLGNTKAMLGVGSPFISPSPFAALCRGVPVILPYHGTTAIPTGWAAFDFAHYHQHAIAALEGPPYVYSVSIDAPVDDLIEVIKTAVATPIDRHIPKDMTVNAVNQRVYEFMYTDWERLAKTRREEKGLGDGAVTLPKFLREWAERDRTEKRAEK